MHKRTNRKADEGTLAKRSKSGGKQVGTEGEMEDTGSPYGMCEMFQRIPALVLEENFDFLDAGQARRLGSAFPEWKPMLTRNVKRSKGIMFLENPTGREGLLVALFCVKLTYARNSFDSDDDWSDIEGSSLTSVSVFQCSLKFYGICTGVANHPCAFWQAYWQQKRRSARLAPSYTSIHYYHDWDLTTNVPSLTVQRGNAQSNHGADVQRHLDKHNLIWPCPQEQTPWLLRSLANLDAITLEAVKDADSAWQVRRNIWYKDGETHLFEDHLPKLGLTTTATSDARELNSIDLAFFGRLLVGLHKLKAIPGFAPPPYPFPDDLKFDLVRRQ